VEPPAETVYDAEGVPIVSEGSFTDSLMVGGGIALAHGTDVATDLGEHCQL